MGQLQINPNKLYDSIQRYRRAETMIIHAMDHVLAELRSRPLTCDRYEALLETYERLTDSFTSLCSDIMRLEGLARR